MKKIKAFVKKLFPGFSEEYDDRNWNTIYLPRSFKATELEKIKGSIWFRKEIYLDEKPSKEKVEVDSWNFELMQMKHMLMV